jgi:type VI secretion system protein ImpG
MSFNKYYQDELTFLRDLGREFAEANPKLAPFLAEPGADPDVERLLEGFAFLAGRLRQKLDDELPELTHGLMALLWPHYLRPTPSMAVLQFEPVVNAISERKVIPAGVEVDATPVDGTACRFRTCYDVPIYPMTLESAQVGQTGAGSRLSLTFALHGSGAFERMGLDTLRLYLHGDPYLTASLYLWMCRHLERVTVTPGKGGNGGGDGGFTLGPERVTPGGLGEDEGLLPYPPAAFLGYRVLQEYFTLPEKFLFVDIAGLEPAAGFGLEDRLTLTFAFDRPFEEQVRPAAENFRLFCTPVANLFEHDADPIRVDHRKTEYRLRPAGSNATHFDIYSVDRVEGWEQGTGARRRYRPFESFDHVGRGRGDGFFRIRRHPSVVGRGLETYLAFGTGTGGEMPREAETVSVTLTCTNRALPERLAAGDVATATGSSPEYAAFRNLTAPTPALPPPMDESLYWRLISNMAVRYVSLGDVAALRTVLGTYDFRAHYDRQAQRQSRLRLEGIEQSESRPAERVFKGLPVRGWRTRLKMRESQFNGEGDLFLFASVLNEFLAVHADINSFHELEVAGLETGEVYRWPPQSGPHRLV